MAGYASYLETCKRLNCYPVVKGAQHIKMVLDVDIPPSTLRGLPGHRTLKKMGIRCSMPG